MTCTCLTTCPGIPDVGPVCGSNGLTYENHCAMRMDVCRKRIDVSVRNTGRCSKCVYVYQFIEFEINATGLVSRIF